MSIGIDRSIFDEWKAHPVTKELLSVMQDNASTLKDSIVGLDLNTTNITGLMSYYRGELYITEQYMNVTFEQLFPKENEEVENEIEKTPYSW